MQLQAKTKYEKIYTYFCYMQEENNPWKIVDKQTVYDNNWISLIHHNVINPAGNKGIYGIVHFKNYAMGIIPVDNDMNTYLVGQYRFALNEYSWEIPEGGCPFNENPLEAAQRELLEETGLKAAHWQLLGESFLSNSVSDEKAIFYVATGLTRHQPQPEDTELLSVKKVPLHEVFQMVEDGTITDALSIIALQKLQLLLLNTKIKI